MKTRLNTRSSRLPRTAAGRPAPRLLASSVAIGALFGSFHAMAQQGAVEAPDPAASNAVTKPEPVTRLDAVEVTARKKAEKLSEVPLSITAVTSQTIQDAGLRNIQDVANLTSGLTISAAGAEAQLAPTIRGLTNLNGGSGDPNVAVFLDGIYLANNSAISLGLVAVERVEIVKGPVSALYGRNAFAGAINYVTKKPPLTTQGEVEVGFSTGDGRTVKATVGGPIVPNVLRWNVSVGNDHSGGTWKDTTSGGRAGGYDKNDGLFSLAFTPTKELLVDASAYYGDDTFRDTPLGNATNNCGSRTSATAIVNANAYKQFCGSFHYDPVQIPVFPDGSGVTGNTRKVVSDKLHIAYDFQWVDASVLYGYNNVKQRRYNDFTGSNIGIPYALADAATPGTQNGNVAYANEQFGNVLNNKDNQIEFRLSSKLDQPVRWSLGYNYYKADAEADTIVGIANGGLPAGQVIANVFGIPVQRIWTTPTGSPGSGFGRTTSTDKVSSPFASADWDILPALTLSGEVRHTKEDKSQTIYSTASNPAPMNVAGNGTNTGTASYSFNNYRTALRYKLTPDDMVYVSLANGTKAGGFNSRATINADLSFNPETNRTVEAGTKLSFLDRKLEVGVAVFHVDTADIQVSGPAADPTNAGLVTKNLGGTRSNGFELDLAAIPVTGLRLNAGLGFADSKFKSDAYDFTVAKADCDAIAVCASREAVVTTPSGPKTAVALSGLRVPRSSRWTGTFGPQYNGVINDQWGWLARADYRIETSRMIQAANFADIPTKKVLNLRWAVESEKYRLTLFINNVTNDTTPEGVAQNVRLNDFNGPYAGALPAKRTYGIVANAMF